MTHRVSALNIVLTIQLIQTVVGNKEDTTQVKLIYANVQQEETLYFDQLNSLEAANPQKFKVHHVLVNVRFILCFLPV